MSLVHLPEFDICAQPTRPLPRREVTVVVLDVGELLSTHRIEPDTGYWRNQRRDPGRWPRTPLTG